MKRIFITMLVLTAIVLTASAQKGLQINSIFGGTYGSDPNVTETMMSGEHRYLTSNGLTVMATFKGPASTYAKIVEPLVLADGAHATGRNVRYKNGKLCFAYFVLPSVTSGGKKINRYLYYLDNAANKGSNVMVLYFEGEIPQNLAATLIQSLIKSVK